MAYITYDDQPPSEELAAHYARFRDPRHGVVDNILRIHSHNPPSLLGHYELYKTLMRGKSPLSKAQREMIAVVVSRANDCLY